jgi:hypothetical protein
MFVTRMLITASLAVLTVAGGSVANAAPMDFSTGTGAWTLTPPGGSSTSPDPITPNSSWISLPGAEWIGPSPGEDPDPTGIYSYVLEFDVTHGGTDLQVDWTSDNGGSLTLSGDFAGTSGTVSTQGQRGTFGEVFTATFSDLAAGSFTLTAEIENLCQTSDTTDCTGEANPTGFIAKAAAVPLPAALWVLLCALAGFAGLHRLGNRGAV